MTLKEFLPIMAILEAGSGAKPASKMQVEIYFEILGHSSADELRRAAKQALAESQYPTIPTVGALLRLVNGSPISTDDRAIVAYGAAARAVHSVGGYQSVTFDDPLVNATVRNMGGWERFCDWPVDELQWRQRDFERHYAALTQAGIAGELAAPLVGICDRENLAGGFLEFVGQTARVKCGLPPQRPGLVTGEIPKPRVANVTQQKRITEVVNGTAARFKAPLAKYVRRLTVDTPQQKPALTDEEFKDHKAAVIADCKRRIAVRNLTVDELIDV